MSIQASFNSMIASVSSGIGTAKAIEEMKKQTELQAQNAEEKKKEKEENKARQAELHKAKMENLQAGTALYQSMMPKEEQQTEEQKPKPMEKPQYSQKDLQRAFWRLQFGNMGKNKQKQDLNERKQMLGGKKK